MNSHVPDFSRNSRRLLYFDIDGSCWIMKINSNLPWHAVLWSTALKCVSSNPFSM